MFVTWFIWLCQVGSFAKQDLSVPKISKNKNNGALFAGDMDKLPLNPKRLFGSKGSPKICQVLLQLSGQAKHQNIQPGDSSRDLFIS